MKPFQVTLIGVVTKEPGTAKKKKKIVLIASIMTLFLPGREGFIYDLN